MQKIEVSRTYSTFLSQILILSQIRFPLITQPNELRIFGLPIGQVVLWQDGKFGALSCCRANKVCGFVEVVLELQWLPRLVRP